MAEILKLRGSPALSAFRLEKLHARLVEVAPGARIAGTEFWHFVEVARALDARERAVLEQRFGLVDGYSRTLEEVGRQFKVTRERIRQIEAKALRKMRHPTRIRHLQGFLETEA